MPPPWKQVVPVIGLFGLYGAWVLRDRSVCCVGRGWCSGKAHLNVLHCMLWKEGGGGKKRRTSGEVLEGGVWES